MVNPHYYKKLSVFYKKHTVHQLYLQLPTTSEKAVKKTSEALKNNDYSYTTEEIDSFLTSSLKGQVKKDSDV